MPAPSALLERQECGWAAQGSTCSACLQLLQGAVLTEGLVLIQNRMSSEVDAADVKARQKEHQAALQAQMQEKKRQQVCVTMHARKT